MGDVVEENMFWLNLSQEELEDLTIRQLQAGEGVMFSCDCHPDGDRANGYWDPDCFQYGEVLGGSVIRLLSISMAIIPLVLILPIIYPAGWIPEEPYDPAVDWGANWMDSWDI